MIAKSSRCLVAVAALVTSAYASDAKAQCCGTATTAFYQPAAYTAYSPVVAPVYRTGWYPGYFLDQVRARLFGAPATYVAAYPTTTYAASYPSTYVASYPAYTASYATSYAPVSSYATSYAPCATCAPTQQVTMRPVTTACCDPCATCSGYSAGGTYSNVTQTSYEQPAGCACGGQTSGGTTIVVPNGTVMTPGTQQGTPYSGGQQPQLPETYQATPRSTEKPAGEEPEPEPAENNGTPAEGTQNETTGDSGASFEAPALFSPNDRTARRSIAPVQTAVYEQPVRHQRVSATPRKVTAQQAERDAIGWRSASN